MTCLKVGQNALRPWQPSIDPKTLKTTHLNLLLQYTVWWVCLAQTGGTFALAVVPVVVQWLLILMRRRWRRWKVSWLMEVNIVYAGPTKLAQRLLQTGAWQSPGLRGMMRLLPSHAANLRWSKLTKKGRRQPPSWTGQFWLFNSAQKDQALPGPTISRLLPRHPSLGQDIEIYPDTQSMVYLPTFTS